MVAAVLGVAIPLLDLVLWAYASRLLYRRYRLHEAKKSACPKRQTMRNHNGNCTKCRYNVLWWEEKDGVESGRVYSNDALTRIAIFHGFFWPVALVGYGIYVFVTDDPPLAPAEVEAARKKKAAADAAYVADLEKQLGEMAKENERP